MLQLRYLLVSFILITSSMGVPVHAAEACGDKARSLFSIARCNNEVNELNNLFKWREEVPNKSIAPTGVSPQEPIYDQEASLLKTEGKQRAVRSYEFVVQSDNKRLSEFGHKMPAELLVRCENKKPYVELYFPGYPMSNSALPIEIAYQVNAGKLWIADFKPTSDFFKIGIDNHRQIELFLSSIGNGEYLDISTRDIEDTKITANFNMADFTAEIRKIRQACRP